LRLFIAVPLFIGESIYLLEYTLRKKRRFASRNRVEKSVLENKTSFGSSAAVSARLIPVVISGGVGLASVACLESAAAKAVY